MQQCPRCNSQNEDSDRFCRECGHQLDGAAGSSETDTDTATKYACANCGITYDSRPSICPDCNTDTFRAIETDTRTAGEVTTSASTSVGGRSWGRIILAVLVVGALVGGGWVAYQQFVGSSPAAFENAVGDAADVRNANAVDDTTWEAHWYVDGPFLTLDDQIQAILLAYADHVPGENHRLRLVIHTAQRTSVTVIDGEYAVAYHKGQISYREYYALVLSDQRNSRWSPRRTERAK